MPEGGKGSVLYLLNSITSTRIVQSSAKHWQYFGSLKFEKTANVWTAKWARIFSKV